MTTTEPQDYSGWAGHDLVDPDGSKIGKVGQIYVDEHTGQADWVTVQTGLFGKKSNFVPMEGTTAEGDKLISAWAKDKVKGAPQVEDDGDGYLTPDEERDLYTYYGRDYDKPAVPPSNERPASAQPGGGHPGVVATDESVPDHVRGEGHDTSGPDTDEAMTRSEEELTVGTATREAGRARLRKYIVTEHVTKTVPVRHEEVRIERKPITDANRDAATSGAELSEEEHEVVLHEEHAVVDKNVVAKERVRLGTETVTGEEHVDETVRKEQIDEESTNPGNPGR